ncbi:MAG: alpha-hydroxy acid oxidase, partial [Candidatus Eiseniibacteriota bacterium]
MTSPAADALRAGRAVPAGAASPPLTVADFEVLARAKMERSAFDYYAGGADDELTLAGNTGAFDELWLRPRVLVDVSKPELSLTLFGDTLSMPILLAPAALHRLAHPEGERAVARAAAEAGTAMVVSTIATYSLEEIAAAASGPRWFQLYLYRDRAVSEGMVHRAEAAGYRALVLTADTPRLGKRRRDVRNGFQIPDHVRLANFEGGAMPGTSFSGPDRTLTGSARTLLHDAITWRDVEWLRGLTRMPVLIKGILT